MVIEENLVQTDGKLISPVEVLYSKSGIINNSLIDSLEFIISKLSCHVKAIIVNDNPPPTPPHFNWNVSFFFNNA